MANRKTQGHSVYNRRNFMKSMAGSLLAGFNSCQSSCRSSTSSRAMNSRPNIIFILADDMGWADVGYHGSKIRTPNIDELATTGVRFDHHYVMPTCTPTRVGFITGRYPSRYGVLAPAYGKIFDDNTVTLPAALKKCGYFTAISGKWHMGSPPECTPTKYGFNSSYGYFHGQIDPYTHLYKTGVKSWQRNDKLIEEKGHATDLITAEAVRIIKSASSRPFFLYVAYSVPHYPLDEPPKYLNIYKKSEFTSESRRWYAASVTHMDEGIGRIIDAVDKAGIRRNTLIVFVSDNGGQKSWHSNTQYKGRYADKPHTVLGDNKPLRGWKGDVYEGGIRVPALANWPGVLRPGRCSVLMDIVDWMPTFCALTGCRPEGNLRWDGINIWPVITGRSQPDKARLLYWKTPGAYALRQGDWKLITRKDFTRPQLFDLAEDPYESHDLAGEKPDRVGRMLEQLKNIARADSERLK